MTIQDLKITSEDYANKDIAGLPDRPSESGMSAADLKARFDASTKYVVQPKLNALIDLLNGSEGAANIGVTPIEGVAGYFVQEVLIALKLLLDDKKSIEQADREIGAKFDTTEAQALVKEITFSESTGVFTITKYDGSVQTIDTAVEKVALDVRLDGQQFVLTLVDGTEQRVDLSAFLTQTEVANSDTITLAIENGAIVARIATGSVMLSHLNAEVTAYIDAKELAAYQSAQAAAVSEQNALNSANAAEASRQAALACQEQACLCATQAGLSQQAAATSESNAATSEQAAKKAQEAAEKAAGEAQAIAGGDFLATATYDPQGKETDVFKYVDDAMTEKFGEEGKLPVQNGGLYINDETTEGDKAEALAGLVGVGGFGFSRKVISGEDLNDIVTPGGYYAGLSDSPNITNIPDDGENGFHLYVLKADSSLDALNGYRTLQIYVRANTDDAIWIRCCQISKWRPWIKIADANKFLPLDGSVPMSGYSLGLLNNKSKIQAGSSGSIQLDAYDTANDENNRRTLLLYSKNAVDDLNKALRLVTRVDEAATYYNIYGEHNTELLASTIQSLIDSGVIEVGARPSSIGYGVVSSRTPNAVMLNITGKGFVNLGGAGKMTLVVDGVNLGKKETLNGLGDNNVIVEFSESIKVTYAFDGSVTQEVRYVLLS